MDRNELTPTTPENGATGAITPGHLGTPEIPATSPAEMRVRAAAVAAKYYGVDMEVRDYRATAGETVPSPASLARWLVDAGLWAKAARLRWSKLFSFPAGPPVVLLLKDGTAALLASADAARNLVFLRDPRASEAAPPIAVDELRLRQLWDGEVLLVRRARGSAVEDEPFTFGWLMRLVLLEKSTLRDISVASCVMAVLTIIPSLMVMIVIDRVLATGNLNTLILLSVLFGICMLFDALLGYAQRELVQVVSTRVDVKLNLHVFNRMLALPIDYFERNPTGETTFRISQVFRIREFLTGRLMNAVLQLFTLVILLPFLFYMSATLAWMVLASSAMIALIIMAFLPSMRRIFGRVIGAEVKKSSVLVESIHGIRTVKSLALEETQKTAWDERVAEAAEWRLRAGRHSNWPQTLSTPIEAFTSRGVVLVGAYILVVNMLYQTSGLAPRIPGLNLGVTEVSGITAGSLVAFMLLGGRVAQPLIQMARMLEEFEDIRNSVFQVGMVLNNPTETNSVSGGLRPQIRRRGELRGRDLHLSARQDPGARPRELPDPGRHHARRGRAARAPASRRSPACCRASTGTIRASSRSTASDLREINLTHLRRSFGVVLQDNFLFRGTVRDNIIAGRPGLTLEDAVRAARLAGAEEFIERLPAGYETYIEEGSANLSGGQRQRLAIARAVIADPRLMILDEATSALDPESEALVNANLQRIAANRTMVIVSHRLSSLVDCDQILVMEQGQVADIGTHRVLLERCAIYRQLWMQQNRHMNSTGDGRHGSIKPVLAEGD